MTAILAWLDDHGAYLCCDSAVSSSAMRPPRDAQSSFGEWQTVDGRPVEEAALKVFPVSSLEVFSGGEGVIAGVVGDLHAAMTTLKLIFTDPRVMEGRLEEVLRTLAPQVTGTKPEFILVFAHNETGGPTLCRLSTREGFVTTRSTRPEDVWILGSLPATCRGIAAQSVAALRETGFDSSSVLMSALVLLQSLGISNYLPQHGVGGAFFGVQLTSTGDVIWQDDICYYVYRPALFSNVSPGELKDEEDILRVRCQVRDSLGLITSSLANANTMKVLVPPGYRRPEERFRHVASDPALELGVWSVPTCHVGLLDTAGRKAISVVKQAPNSIGMLEFERNDDTMLLRFRPELERHAAAPVAPDVAWQLVVAREVDATGSEFRVIRVRTA